MSAVRVYGLPADSDKKLVNTFFSEMADEVTVLSAESDGSSWLVEFAEEHTADDVVATARHGLDFLGSMLHVVRVDDFVLVPSAGELDAAQTTPSPQAETARTAVATATAATAVESPPTTTTTPTRTTHVVDEPSNKKPETAETTATSSPLRKEDSPVKASPVQQQQEQPPQPPQQQQAPKTATPLPSTEDSAWSSFRAPAPATSTTSTPAPAASAVASPTTDVSSSSPTPSTNTNTNTLRSREAAAPPSVESVKRGGKHAGESGLAHIPTFHIVVGVIAALTLQHWFL